MTSWSLSGSRRSPRAVEPVTSANRTVTSLRSWPAAVGSATVVPQAEQNRAPSGSVAPQRGQDAPSGVPHEAQKRAPSAFCAPQFEQAAMCPRVYRRRPTIRHPSAPGTI